MPDTYSQIYIQIVFAVKNRNALIQPIWEDELFKYISGITQNKNQKMLSIKWQEGFGAFSYSHSQVTSVIQYINNQKEQHKKKRFKNEYLDFLNSFEIQFKDECLFNWIENE